jgi:hypothetical protein
MAIATMHDYDRAGQRYKLPGRAGFARAAVLYAGGSGISAFPSYSAARRMIRRTCRWRRNVGYEPELCTPRNFYVRRVRGV